mmetsp:Transcript_38151/g.74941  ORF Transcript_38151/g.74941 Transcript_38151/m.74941 type:complete len:87 (+) Transcript_38151:544-804(+)
MITGIRDSELEGFSLALTAAALAFQFLLFLCLTLVRLLLLHLDTPSFPFLNFIMSFTLSPFTGGPPSCPFLFSLHLKVVYSETPAR